MLAGIISQLRILLKCDAIECIFEKGTWHGMATFDMSVCQSVVYSGCYIRINSHAYETKWNEE